MTDIELSCQVEEEATIEELLDFVKTFMTAKTLKSFLEYRILRRRGASYQEQNAILTLFADQIDDDGLIEDVLPNFLESEEGKDYDKHVLVNILHELVPKARDAQGRDEIGFSGYLDYCRMWLDYVPPMRAANKSG